MTRRRRQLWPLLALLVGLPIVASAVRQSLTLLNAPFPGFLLMNNAVVPSVGGYDWPPDKGFVFHSQVIAVDETPVHGSADVQRYVQARPLGAPITYTFRKGTVIEKRVLASRLFTSGDYLQVYAILLLIACLSLGVGVVAGFMQPRTTQARVYLLLSFVGCIYTASAVFLHQPDFIWMTRVYFVAECFFPATLTHLALVFPVERRFSGWRRLWFVVPYSLSAVLTALVLRGFDRQPPTLEALHVTYLYTAGCFVFLFGALIYGFWENRDPRARLRVKAILPSAVLGGALTAFAFTNSAFHGGSFPLQLGLVFVPAFYLSIAYAIVKHDLFDIDRVVRQSSVYALLSLIVLSAYALVLALPARGVPPGAGTRTTLGMVFVLVLAFALDPLRRFVQRVVDRAFYRTRLDYRATIGELSEVLTTLLDLRQVLAQVTRVVTEAMHLRSMTVCLLPSAGRAGVQWTRAADGSLREEQPDAAVASLLDVLDERSPTACHSAAVCERIDPPVLRETVRTFLTGVAASIVLPLVCHGRPIGLMVLGPKQSGQGFGSDDIDLLSTLANQTAIALENARSYQGLAELTRDLDAKVRQQTDALRTSNAELSHAYDELKQAQAQLVQSEKLASLGQLVAGVAHELNNPASFVHGGLANLEEYLNRFVTLLRVYEQAAITDPEAAQAIERVRHEVRLDYLLREMPELLRICAEGSQRIKRIVDDLRVFARTDSGDRAPTDIAAGVEGSLRMLGGRLQRLGIRVRTDYRPVPRVEVNAGQLNQVWLNLLSNAVDAVEGRTDGTIDVCVRLTVLESSNNGTHQCVEVEVRDNGVGIAPRDQPRLFEPFFTTKPIGKGTGLGLSIAYGAVKSHGGTIAIHSAPDQGTTVIVRLPVGT